MLENIISIYKVFFEWLQYIVGNHTNLTQFIASAATLCTVVLIFFTLLEMINQRKSSFKPEIVFDSNRIYFYLEQIDDLLLPRIFTMKEANEEELKNNNISKDIELDCYNLGLGAAKSLEFEWDFDIPELVKLVKAKDRKNIFEIKCDKKGYGLKIFNTNYGEAGSFIKKKNYVFILPSQVSSIPKKVKLPNAYLNLTTLLLYFDLINFISGSSKAELFNYPSIKLLVRFLDIGNNQHVKKFFINFKFGPWSGEMNKKYGWAADARISVTEE